MTAESLRSSRVRRRQCLALDERESQKLGTPNCSFMVDQQINQYRRDLRRRKAPLDGQLDEASAVAVAQAIRLTKPDVHHLEDWAKCSFPFRYPTGKVHHRSRGVLVLQPTRNSSCQMTS